ncbi:MAG: LysM peptidoglycan-binding domain-containing protein [Candidatus Riflebacteria bacterium]|nr:LysM peptidoglycan-binding domain-containing protein [Candidatus Riflebacteria bacterium]
MRTKLIAVVIMAILALPAGAFAKSADWWKPGSWFNKKSRSTTITGVVDSVADGKIMFKTLDGQNLLLIGDSAAKVGENRSVKIRVFGNVSKPDQKYPNGAVQVRSFKVLEEAPVIAAEPISEPEPYIEPEPIEEPAPYVPAEPVAVADDEYEDDAEPSFVSDDTDVDEAVVEPVVEEKTYVVTSGDTLGKISQKVYGTTGKWKKIAERNGITNPKLLKVGMTLRIP